MNISVIIPVYNCEKYIKRCLNSVLIQSYKNIEIIVINDGSKDNSENIIKTIKDDRIKFISRDNKGALYTRKEGIKIATGEYLIFLDADDFLEEYAITRIVDKINEYNKPDIIKFPYIKEFIEEGRARREKNPYSNEIYIKKNQYNNLIYPVMINTYFFNSMCCQVIKKKLINLKTIDTSLIMGEDLKFNLDIISKSKNILIINEYLYHYIYNKSSITTTYDLNNIKRKINNVVEVYSLLIKYAKIWKINSKYDDIILERILKETIYQASCYFKINNKNKNFKEYNELFKNKKIENIKLKLKNKKINNKLIKLFLKNIKLLYVYEKYYNINIFYFKEFIKKILIRHKIYK